MTEGIVFQVETSRVLEILAKEIYDSPLAMLRENVQNAYDAIRMRFAESGALASGSIDITIKPGVVTISDNGVGMTEDVLRNNFWKAGSSGKNSPSARKAGVVGTFGIGAMANFGVCTRLTIETRAVGSDEILRSVAVRDALKIGEECINFERLAAQRDVGTSLIADLDPKFSITQDQATQYLLPYVGLIEVSVRINGQTISGQSWKSRLPIGERSFAPIGRSTLNDNLFGGFFDVSVDPNGQVMVVATGITIGRQEVVGELRLVQSGGQLMGLRSGFGLAPIPASGQFQLGGIANLSFLQPTAGREALSRESIEQVTRLINLAEQAASERLAESEFVDSSNAFLQWIVSHNRYDLAERVTIRMLPQERDVRLGELAELSKQQRLQSYDGTDPSIIATFANEAAPLLQVVQANPRRTVQHHFLRSASIPTVPQTAQILREYVPAELSLGEASVLIRVAGILREDYLVPDARADLADISHGVNLVATSADGQLRLWIARNSTILSPILEVYSKAYELFTQFMKDFVRVHVYPKIQQYVPSSTRGGVDALRGILERNRELYRYEETERGDLENVLGEYLSGTATFAEVLTTSRAAARSQSQTLSSDQVGSIESVVPDVVESPVIALDPGSDAEYSASPPIIRDGIATDKKLLTTSAQYAQLNNFRMFLGLSDRLVRTEGDFFRAPHTSRVLWGGHRVIFIFTEATGRLSLYYDIQLREPIDAAKSGGSMFPTTTLVTKDRIFVPIPEKLESKFQIDAGPKEFIVRFDLLSNEGK